MGFRRNVRLPDRKRLFRSRGVTRAAVGSAARACLLILTPCCAGPLSRCRRSLRFRTGRVVVRAGVFDRRMVLKFFFEARTGRGGRRCAGCLRGRIRMLRSIRARRRIFGEAYLRRHGRKECGRQNARSDFPRARLGHRSYGVLECEHQSKAASCAASGPATGLAAVPRPRNSVCSAGTTTSNMIGPISIPPTITVASGRCT